MAKAELRQSVPIFVSSTYEDLIPYRTEVQSVLLRLEQVVKGMEYFGSNSQKPLDVCLETVRCSKIFIGIIGMRYGSVEEENGKSYTQLEYEEAIKNKIPILIYIISEEHPIPSKFVDKNEKAQLLKKFKDLLCKNHTVSFFTTPDDLGKKISADLLDVLETLDQITVNKEAKNEIAEDFDEIFKKFMFRPAKYLSREGILNVRISDMGKSCGTLRSDIVYSLGMIPGDAVCVPVYVIDEKNLNNLTPSWLLLYGEKELGDWIEDVQPGTIAKIKVRLNYTVSKEVTRCDNGTILSDVNYFNLVLLEIVSVSNFL